MSLEFFKATDALLTAMTPDFHELHEKKERLHKKKQKLSLDDERYLEALRRLSREIGAMRYEIVLKGQRDAIVD